VLLWSHDHTIPAIGTATKIWVEGFGDSGQADVQRHVAKPLPRKGRLPHELVKQGILNSFSVGFIPSEMEGNKYTRARAAGDLPRQRTCQSDAVMLAYKSLKENGFSEQVAKQVTQQFAGIRPYARICSRPSAGALQDELDEEAAWEAKYENMPMSGMSCMRCVMSIIRQQDASPSLRHSDH
jgi:hypothetical protein